MTKTLPRRYRKLGRDQRDPAWAYGRSVNRLIKGVAAGFNRALGWQLDLAEVDWGVPSPRVSWHDNGFAMRSSVLEDFGYPVTSPQREASGEGEKPDQEVHDGTSRPAADA